MSESKRYLPLVDTHAHLNLEDFQNDCDALIHRSRRGILPEIPEKYANQLEFAPFLAAIICPATDLNNTRIALELSKRYEYVFATAGVHPNYTIEITEEEWNEIKRLIEQAAIAPINMPGRIVAVGETGLDRYRDASPFELQVRYFVESIQLSLEHDLPIIIHSRETNDELDRILHDYYSDVPADKRARVGVVHSFSGTPEQAERWIELGFHLGFGGFVTYPSKKFADIWEAAKRAPSDRILLETDCPYLTPHPVRGRLERNEPLAAAFAAQRLAQLRGVDVEEITNAARENAIRLFRLPELPNAPETDE